VRTAAVVVNWEGGAATERCVASLLAQDAPPDEIVVVDNASGPVEVRASTSRSASGAGCGCSCSRTTGSSRAG
jgi:GT2 family glycosyltransferase